jgi:hypothetical protein
LKQAWAWLLPTPILAIHVIYLQPEGMRWITVILLAAASLAPQKAPAQEIAVDLELVLAIDGSRSIDDREFALQLRGTADAFRDRAFFNALHSAAPRGIAVTMVQWAGHEHQAHVVAWRHVEDAISAAAFADEIVAAGRRLSPGPTGIGSAIRFSRQLMETNGFAGARRVIDISGDGSNNSGNRPEIARDEALARGVTINGLTVTNEIPGLDRYFSARVIGGPGAFVIEALDFEQFAVAFKLKLIREVTGDRVTLTLPDRHLGSNGGQVSRRYADPPGGPSAPSHASTRARFTPKSLRPYRARE